LALGDCPQDCDPACGDGLCSGGEDYQDCPVDCGFCGDAVCGFSETESSCPPDCLDGCGDGLCKAQSGEDAATCPKDCDTDLDQDGVDSTTDNCPLTPNPAQADLDNDQMGDACDQDDDGDGETDVSDCGPMDKTVSHC
jgi:hypothetical protein